MYDYGKPDPATLGFVPTGRAFISPCCTSSIREFIKDGRVWLVGRVAGHGWNTPRLGLIDDINDTGILADGDREVPVRYSEEIEKNPLRIARVWSLEGRNGFLQGRPLARATWMTDAMWQAYKMGWEGEKIGSR